MIKNHKTLFFTRIKINELRDTEKNILITGSRMKNNKPFKNEQLGIKNAFKEMMIKGISKKIKFALMLPFNKLFKSVSISSDPS
jgi:hypothetical protein